MKSAVIFDLDGTLLDTQKDIALLCNQLFEQNGFPSIPLNHYYRFMGEGIKELVDRAYREGTGESLTDTNLKRMTADFFELYKNNPCLHTQPYEGIVPLLAELKDRSFFMAIATNKPDAIAKIVVRDLFPDFHFDLIYGPCETMKRKPDPMMVETIIQKSGCSREDFIYMGDSLVDLETAKKSRLTFAGLSWGYETEENLRQAGAQIVLSHPKELLSHL